MSGIKDIMGEKDLWEKKGFSLPQFDREAVKKKTKANPKWVHFGAGNIFRAFPAVAQQNLLNSGLADTGIIVAEGYDYEIIDRIFLPNDSLSLAVTLKADGGTKKTLVGSIVEALKVDSFSEDFNRLKEIFASESLQLISFTITEKGYILKDNQGEFYSDIKADFAQGVVAPTSYIGKLVALCYHRFKNGEHPAALVSMDNCSKNGDKLKDAVVTVAEKWLENSFVEKEFLAYLKDGRKVSFPWTMIDKITPRPDEQVEESLKKMDLAEISPIVTAKNTFVAPFVNAEETEYLVVEDHFPNGRPPLEKSGIIFTDRETVEKVEQMKVSVCLNPLHTALAVFGCLLGYSKISDEMQDKDIVALIKSIGYSEGLPVVVNPKIINPKEFLDTVINIRFPNPFMPDTPQRIATDTSQKLAVRFGETIKAYYKSETLDINSLESIPLVIAGWCRYLMGIDDTGEPFEVSSDPLWEKLQETLVNVKLGDTSSVGESLVQILSNEAIFGVDLYEVGLGKKVENYFKSLISGKGAVRHVLENHIIYSETS